jgi:hypothetical protein
VRGAARLPEEDEGGRDDRRGAERDELRGAVRARRSTGGAPAENQRRDHQRADRIPEPPGTPGCADEIARDHACREQAERADGRGDDGAESRGQEDEPDRVLDAVER